MKILRGWTITGYQSYRIQVVFMNMCYYNVRNYAGYVRLNNRDFEYFSLPCSSTPQVNKLCIWVYILKVYTTNLLSEISRNL